MATEPCNFHPGLQSKIDKVAEEVAEMKAYSKSYKDQITKLFDRIDEIREFVTSDRVETRYQSKDIDSLIECSKQLVRDVAKVQYTVENGLNARVNELAEAIKKMSICIEQRKRRQLSDLNEYSGWSYFIRVIGISLEEQLRKYAGLIVLALVGTLIYLITHMRAVESFVERIFG